MLSRRAALSTLSGIDGVGGNAIEKILNCSVFVEEGGLKGCLDLVSFESHGHQLSDLFIDVLHSVNDFI